MAYVDGYILAVPKKNLKKYYQLANKAAAVWMDHGALDYKEAVGDDLKPKGMMPFSSAVKVKAGEALVFAYVLFKSRKHRDSVNAKVMKDPRVKDMCKSQEMPFDVGRMVYGGFEVMVDGAGKGATRAK